MHPIARYHTTLISNTITYYSAYYDYFAFSSYKKEKHLFPCGSCHRLAIWTITVLYRWDVFRTIQTSMLNLSVIQLRRVSFRISWIFTEKNLSGTRTDSCFYIFFFLFVFIKIVVLPNSKKVRSLFNQTITLSRPREHRKFMFKFNTHCPVLQIIKYFCFKIYRVLVIHLKYKPELIYFESKWSKHTLVADNAESSVT